MKLVKGDFTFVSNYTNGDWAEMLSLIGCDDEDEFPAWTLNTGAKEHLARALSLLRQYEEQTGDVWER